MYYKNSCPYAGTYTWDQNDMYRLDEKSIEEVKNKEIQNCDGERQYPGAAPGMKPMPGMMPGQYTGNPAEIMRLIEINHPDIMRTMMAYGIPLPTGRRIIMRIIRTALRYCR